MSGPWTSIRIAQVIGFGGAAWLSGNIASLTLITIPTLLNSQSAASPSSPPITLPTPNLPSKTLTQQWRHTYELGKSQNPPISALIGASFAYLAYKARSGPRNVITLYGLAALLTMGIAPYTLVVMKGTNGRLIAKSEEKEGAVGEGKGASEEGEVRGLLERWGRLNAVRSLLPLVGGLAGVVAALA